MSTPRFDLPDIIRLLQRRNRFVITITLLSMALGVLFFMVRKKKYQAKAAFFVSNPIYADRSTIFAGADSRYTDYFGDEDDIDRVIALSESDTVIFPVVVNSGLDKAYNLDINNPKDAFEIKQRFLKSLDLKRTEYKLMELAFTDKDPELSARVVNESVKQLENGYRSFYTNQKASIYNSIRSKVKDMDSTINSLTDSLVKLRVASGINELLSPNRENFFVGSIKGNGNETGKYIELIQNIEADKDLLVTDRARYQSLMNQYSTAVQPGQVSFLHIITNAKPPVDPAGPPLIIMLAAFFFLGLFFSVVYVLLSTYYREVVLVRE
jgi:uncharacterized protein involved in exopolysaccharide biosynthesis